jgi:DNA polymerase I-like protein with 3'-5' exonuclease and polymerase domains
VDPDFGAIKHELKQATIFVAFNAKFDLHWLTREGFNLPVNCKVWDCMLAEFVISGQTIAFPSLNDTLARIGLELKDDLVASYWNSGIDTLDIPVNVLEEYNSYDSDCLIKVKDFQMATMSPEQIKLVYLLGEDLKGIVHAEQAGIKFDKENAKRIICEIEKEYIDLDSTLASYVGNTSSNFVVNLDSGDHLSALLYGGTIKYVYSISSGSVYKSGENKGKHYIKNSWFPGEHSFPRIFEPLAGTEVKKTIGLPETDTHFYQTDEPTLKQLVCRTKKQKALIETLGKRAKILKVKEMIISIMNKFTEFNWQDDLIHAQFNQTVARTGRLSSSGPNMQNTPVLVDELLTSRYSD